MQETAEAIKVAPGAISQSKVSRREIVLQESAQCDGYAAEVTINFEMSSRD
jgi:hypothetical protein